MIALSEHTAYYTNKAGMIFFIREMATELGPFGITAHAISPKNIETERSQRYWRAEQMKLKIPYVVLLYLNK